MEKTIAGFAVRLDDMGYMVDLNEWNKTIAVEIAKEEGIEMTDRHWVVVKYLQDEVKKGVALTIRKIGNSGVVTIKEFYQLFPKGPLKTAAHIAGIPKPVSCI